MKFCFWIWPHKDVGPDGFSVIFYQQFLDELIKEIITKVNELFEAGRFEPHFNNHINLRLILKVFPQKKDEIALCNVIYNIISIFFLENRLKKHLGDISTENQNAFNPGRMIIIILLSHMRYSIDWSSLRNRLNHIWGLKQI